MAQVCGLKDFKDLAQVLHGTGKKTEVQRGKEPCQGVAQQLRASTEIWVCCPAQFSAYKCFQSMEETDLTQIPKAS